MAQAGSYVTVTTEGGRPAEALARLLEQRAKWLKESSEQSVRAIAIDVLVSLRALTAQAKPKKTEIKLESTDLRFSRVNGSSRRPCLRRGKAMVRLKADERLVTASQGMLTLVYKWHDIYRKKSKTWYIACTSQKDALAWAYAKVKKRAESVKGLARTALGLLMKGSGSKTAPKPEAGSYGVQTAHGLTRVTLSQSGNQFGLRAEDMLDYAKLALKGGDSAIDTAMMKAANKATGLINQKCKDLLTFKKLDTPFPEVA